MEAPVSSGGDRGGGVVSCPGEKRALLSPKHATLPLPCWVTLSQALHVSESNEWLPIFSSKNFHHSFISPLSAFCTYAESLYGEVTQGFDEGCE